jgi:hypothetical protein
VDDFNGGEKSSSKIPHPLMNTFQSSFLRREEMPGDAPYADGKKYLTG